MNGSIRKPFLPGKPYYIANNEWFKGSGDPVNNAPILATEQAVNGEIQLLFDVEFYKSL